MYGSVVYLLTYMYLCLSRTGEKTAGILTNSFQTDLHKQHLHQHQCCSLRAVCLVTFQIYVLLNIHLKRKEQKVWQLLVDGEDPVRFRVLS